MMEPPDRIPVRNKYYSILRNLLYIKNVTFFGPECITHCEHRLTRYQKNS